MWGSAEPAQPISVDGRPASVRQNPWAALKSLRGRHGPRTLWIDALCINQDDVLERNAQVAIMGRIYREAKKVLVWLGEAADDSDTMFEWMNSPDGGQRTWLGSDWRLLEDMWGKALLAVSCRRIGEGYG